MISAEVFSTILTTLHSTPLDPRNWELFLRQVCDCTDSMHGFFICSSSSMGTNVFGHGGSRDMAEAQRIYNESAGAIDPYRVAFMQRPSVGIVDGDELVTEEELHQTLLYKHILHPAGLRHLTIMALSTTPRRLEAVSVWRTAEQGRMQKDQRAFLRLLLPHVQIALDVRHKLRGFEQHAENVETMLDRTASAAFLLTGGGKVVHFNEPAKAMLAGCDGIEIRKGKLCASERTTDAQLQRLLQPSQLTRRPAEGGAMLVSRTAGIGRPLQVVATPLPSEGMAASRAAMMVLVTDPETEVSFPDTVLKGLYGLTPAEADVANAYLTGYSSEEIALLRRVSVSTVRSQLKVLLHKTGTKRQSDLMRLLMTLPRGTRGEAGMELL